MYILQLFHVCSDQTLHSLLSQPLPSVLIATTLRVGAGMQDYIAHCKHSHDYSIEMVESHVNSNAILHAREIPLFQYCVDMCEYNVQFGLETLQRLYPLYLCIIPMVLGNAHYDYYYVHMYIVKGALQLYIYLEQILPPK